MEPNALVRELVSMARQQAARPGGREQIVSALKAALAAVDGRCGSCCSTRPGVEVAIAELIEHLRSASEHAEFLREIITPLAR